MKHITIKDVEKRVNCSISTVSRAFNDKYDIRKEKRDLILATAKEMGYSPNPIAKSLLKQCTNQIGVIVPEFINTFFPEVIIGIQDVFLKKGYQILIMQSGESHQAEIENIKTMENNMVDGMIISLTLESKNVDYLKSLIEKGFPLVIFNRVSNDLETSKVIIDDYKWAFFATEHLIYQGYKKIFHFDIDVRAAAVAYNFTLAVFPTIIFLFSLLAYIPVDNFDIKMVNFLKSSIPKNLQKDFTELLLDLIRKKSGGVLSFGLLFALYASTSGIQALI